MESRFSVRQRKNAAFEVKAEGNERFRNGRLRSALECYEEAVRMDPTEPVYYANRSTCLYELGQYAASCEDSKQASLLYRDRQKIGMISRAEANTVIGKLLRQSARSFLCMNTEESLLAARSLLARAVEIHPDPDAELLSMQAGAIAAVEEAASASAGEDSGPGPSLGGPDGLPRYRAAVIDAPYDYSCVGWEAAISGLGGRLPTPADTESPLSSQGGTFGEDEENGAIDLAYLTEGERHIRLLFGGVGDGGQILATFRDVYQQVNASRGQLEFNTISLSLIFNDLKAECLARTLIMLKALEDLGCVLKTAASDPPPKSYPSTMSSSPAEPQGEGQHIDPLDLLEVSEDVAVAAYRCYHLYLGAFLLPHEADWLQALLDNLTKGPNDSTLGFSWLRLGPSQLEQVRNVLVRWQVMCKAMSPDVMAKCYASALTKSQEEEPVHMEDEALPEDREVLSAQEAWREQVREAMIERLGEISDDEIMMMSEAQGTTPDEKGDFMKDYWATKVDSRTLDLMRHLPSAHREMEFFHKTMVLPVPLPECSRLELLDRSKEGELYKAWRPNVTLLPADDAALEAAIGGSGGSDSNEKTPPIELHFCPFKSLKLLLVAPSDEDLVSRQEAFRSAATFFGEAALGLVGLQGIGGVEAEIYLGDVHDLGSCREPGSFDRILISNVPDYTTMLPSMVRLMPLLKPTPGAVLKHSVLKFNSLFKDSAEYAHSMGLYVPDMASLPLYLGVNHEYGGIWAHLIEWSRAVNLHEKEIQIFPPGPDVQAWLATIFLSIAMPLARDAESRETEIRPLTLHAFFEVCQYLTSQLGFPPHNLGWVIENVMRGELKTAALVPDQSPWPSSNTWRRQYLPRAIPTGAFALETRTLAGLWQSRLGFRLCPPVGKALPRPGDITEVRITVPEAGVYGFHLARVVGVALLSPTFVKDHADALSPPATTTSSSASSSSNDLRSLLLAKEAQANGHVHLFSCVRWESKISNATILLPKRDLRQLVNEDYHFVLLRTDSWVPLAPSVALANTPMGKAVELLMEEEEESVATTSSAAAAAGGRGGAGEVGGSGKEGVDSEEL